MSEPAYYTKLTADQQRCARKCGAINHDIYERRLNRKKYPKHNLTPHSMYFYYVRINEDGGLVVDHYFYVDGNKCDPKTWKQIPYKRKPLKKLITRLAHNARPSVWPKDPPRLLGERNFKNIKWRHKSYVVIFVDEGKWEFCERANGNSAVTFIVKEGGKVGTPNHTFFDAMDFRIKLPIRNPKPGGPFTDKRSAILFINHMKADDAGTDLAQGQDEPYEFKMFLDVKFAKGGDAPMVVVLDPGGENGGPSVPPPPPL